MKCTHRRGFKTTDAGLKCSVCGQSIDTILVEFANTVSELSVFKKRFHLAVDYLTDDQLIDYATKADGVTE